MGIVTSKSLATTAGDSPYRMPFVFQFLYEHLIPSVVPYLNQFHHIAYSFGLFQEVSADEGNSEELNQPEMQDEGNKDAARALLRVKQKLDGYEGGEMRSLQGQVQRSRLHSDANALTSVCSIKQNTHSILLTHFF